VKTQRSLVLPWGVGLVLLAGIALVACRTTPQAAEPGAHAAGAGDAAAAPAAGLKLAVVYFDFDSAVLRPDARAAIRKNAEEIRGASAEVITLEGYTDERGSAEYNLALGERRGEAVRGYLIDLGIPATRMQVVSFGMAKPAVVGHDESAWKWNRRVESH